VPLSIQLRTDDPTIVRDCCGTSIQLRDDQGAGTLLPIVSLRHIGDAKIDPEVCSKRNGDAVQGDDWHEVKYAAEDLLGWLNVTGCPPGITGSATSTECSRRKPANS